MSEAAKINMQDIRLICGEGKLEPRHVLNAVNLILERRSDPDDLTEWKQAASVEAGLRREFQEAEAKLGAAYLRLRALIPGAFDTPHAPTGEQVWETTEKALIAALRATPAGMPSREGEVQQFYGEIYHANGCTMNDGEAVLAAIRNFLSLTSAPTTDLPKSETMLTYASILEKPQYVVKNGVRYQIATGEIIEAACAALRYCASLTPAFEGKIR